MMKISSESRAHAIEIIQDLGKLSLTVFGLGVAITVLLNLF